MRKPPSSQPVVASVFALLAMLLLLVAPVISQHLMWRTPGDIHPHHEMPMAEMPGMTGDSSGHRAHHSQSVPPLAADPMAACGYCELLIHVPLVLWQFIPLCWLIFRLCHTRPPDPVIVRVSRPFPSRHSSRGPPVAADIQCVY